MISSANSEDLNCYKDLLEHFSNSLLIVEQHNVLKKEKSNLETILKKLTEDVENLQASEKNLTNQLRALVQSSQMQDCINDLYRKLKDNYSDLEMKYKNLVHDNEILHEKSLLEITELKEHYKTQQNKIVEDFTQRLKSLEMQLQEEHNHFLERESQLYNELQLAQATNALQSDESEAKVESLHLQLRDSIASLNTLRQDYVNLKTQSKFDLETANKCINDLERKLRITEQQLRMNQEQLFNYKSRSPEPNSNLQVTKQPITPTDTFTFSVPFKYDALELKPTISKKQSKLHSANIKNVTKSILSIDSNANNSARKSYLPALKQLSKPGQKLTLQKKRKLYNPGAIDLQDFEEQV